MSAVGTCTVVIRNGAAVIVCADQRIRVARELVEVARSGTADGLALDDDGAVLVVTADRTVRYQLHDDGDEHSVAASLVELVEL